MIYLLHDANPKAIKITVCEQRTARVAKLQAQGYRTVSRKEYVSAWRALDGLALVALGLVRQPKVKPPRIRAVGGWEVGDFWNKQ